MSEKNAIRSTVKTFKQGFFGIRGTMTLRLTCPWTRRKGKMTSWRSDVSAGVALADHGSHILVNNASGNERGQIALCRSSGQSYYSTGTNQLFIIEKFRSADRNLIGKDDAFESVPDDVVTGDQPIFTHFQW